MKKAISVSIVVLLILVQLGLSVHAITEPVPDYGGEVNDLGTGGQEYGDLETGEQGTDEEGALPEENEEHATVPEVEETEDQAAIREAFFNVVPESNNLTDWPQGPFIYARSAIVMEIGSGAILYSKNPHIEMYPASITKLLTMLVAIENSELTDEVEITAESVEYVRWEYANIGMREGEVMTMEDALHALMLASANEVAHAIAVTVGNNVDGGGYDTFIRLMNEKALEIGTERSNWINPTGLHDDEHFTTAYDMALITSYLYEFPEYELVMSKLRYVVEDTGLTMSEYYGTEEGYMDGYGEYGYGEYGYEEYGYMGYYGYAGEAEEYPPVDEPVVRVIYQDHQMLNNPVNYFYYTMANGGKTGFTNQAGTTLVTTAHNGDFSVAVVLLFEHGQEAYRSTIALLDYAFENFRKIYLEDSIIDHHVASMIHPDDYIMLPYSVDFSVVHREINLINEYERLGVARYTHEGQFLGEAQVVVTEEFIAYLALPDVEEVIEEEEEEEEIEETLNLGNLIIFGIAIVIALIIILIALLIRKISMKRIEKELQFRENEKSRERGKDKDQFDDRKKGRAKEKTKAREKVRGKDTSRKRK